MTDAAYPLRRPGDYASPTIPGSGSDPLEISLAPYTDDYGRDWAVTGIEIMRPLPVDCYTAIGTAGTGASGDAADKLGAAATRGQWLTNAQGWLPLWGRPGDSLFVRAQGAGASTNGLSYHLTYAPTGRS